MANDNEKKTSDKSTIQQAVQAIKHAILQSQLKVAQLGNHEQLALYYGIGHFVSDHSRNGYWGKSAINSISEQLQKEMPGLRGFSVANIKNMRTFYEQWSLLDDTTVMTDELAEKNSPVITDELENLPNVIRQSRLSNLNFTDFVGISFTHHIEILNSTTTVEERLFYIHHAYVCNMPVRTLRNLLKADLYHHQGTKPNNFMGVMPNKVTALRAIEMFKDEYLLDFMNVEELGARDIQDVDERMLEQQIVHNVKNFIMTFGRDFTFVGNQYHLEKFNHDLYPDLLFYNRELSCLVAVELKRGECKPAYLGQLNAYLRVLDAEVKKPFENPSIGIILCQDADKSYVEFLLQGYDNPMGVATYKTKDDILKLLPSQEDLLQLLNENK